MASPQFFKSLFIAAITAAGVSHQAASAGTAPVAPRIEDEIAAHTEHFEPRIYQVGQRVYSAVGWNISNIVMIEGEDGIILVDAGLSPASSRQVLSEFRKITDKPIKAIIYSHFHHDHIDGIKGLVSEQEIRDEGIRLIAHESLLGNLTDESLLLGPILALRGGYTFGFMLNPADRQGMNAGIGPLPEGGRPGSFIAPNELVGDRLQTEIAGITLDIMHVPSEAPDELAIYLPEDNILIDTEVLQGPTFPNVYTLRGTKFRDPAVWVRSIDRLRALKADHLVPTHGQPVSGADRVDEVLTMTRDGIQYLLDQSIRWMNRGYTPDELAQHIKLPPHLESYAPYLRPYYGTVQQSVREIYVGQLGWYQGDPVALNPVPNKERNRRLVQLMGGGATVLRAAQQAYKAEDFQWAAELATLLLDKDAGDTQARDIKAAAFRQMGYASININWRNWYLTSAMELEGALEQRLAAVDMRAVFLPPDIVAALPTAAILHSMTSRLKAEQALTTQQTLAIGIEGEAAVFGLQIHRGVCRFIEGAPSSADFTLTLDRDTLNGIVTGQDSFALALGSNRARLTGNPDAFLAFMELFEDPWQNKPSLTLR
ncbi:MAG: alkyl sulfatase dimerization domain-containing protein [Luminiphilus sp.]